MEIEQRTIIKYMRLKYCKNAVVRRILMQLFGAEAYII
jgi:hypothetical protein